MLTNRNLAFIAALAALVAAGLGVAILVTGSEKSTVSACATASTPQHPIEVDGITVHVIPGDTVSSCSSATVPTQTVTTTIPTGTTTVPPDTSTSPPTTTTTPPGNASLFLAPNGSDSNSCTQSKPCKTFDKAYRLAAPGQVVEMAAGAYPQQNLSVDASKTSENDVVFRPAAGAHVTVADMNVHGSHITFENFKIPGGDWTTFHETDDITFRNVSIENGGFYTQSSSDISIIGGSVGPILNNKPQIGVWPQNTANKNILVEGVNFHDITRDNTSVHIECLLIGGAVGLIVRNNTFHNCSVFDLSIGAMNGTNSSDVTIEGNTFGATYNGDGYFTLFLNDEPGEIHNILVNNNTAEQEMYFSYGTPGLTNFRVTNNTGPMQQSSCDSRITYENNHWAGAKCGPTDTNTGKAGKKK